MSGVVTFRLNRLNRQNDKNLIEVRNGMNFKTLTRYQLCQEKDVDKKTFFKTIKKLIIVHQKGKRHFLSILAPYRKFKIMIHVKT